MAVATPNSRPRVGDGSPSGARPGRGSRAARALLAALAVALLYAAFADGSTQLPEESWLQVGIATVGVAAGAAWLYGGLRLRASTLGWLGLALLGAYAAWSAASIAWSVAPDRSWAAVNRSISYVVFAGLGLALGASLPRAPERVARMLALVSLPVALYALGGKTLPGLNLAGIVDFNHAGGYNRLKSPLEYWNALALFCVIGMLPMLRLAADPHRPPGRRIGALLGAYVLVLVIGLTYSRGGLLALGAGLAVMVALTTERVRTLALFASAIGASVLPLGVALTRPDLTADVVPLDRREDDALMVLVTVLVVAVLLVIWGRALIAAEDRVAPERTSRVGRRVALLAAGALAAVFLASLAAGRVGEVIEGFKDTNRPAAQTDPNRLLSANSGNRWTWWQEAAGAWADEPLTGWGAGSFPVTHRLYRTELLSVQQPHSVPLQWLAETGLIGLLLAGGGLLALLAAALARVRALPWAVAGAPPQRGYAATLAAVAAAWVVHAFYDWDWDIPAVTAPILVALGVLAARPERPVVGAEAPRSRGPAVATAAVLFVLVVLSAALPAFSETRTASALSAVDDRRISPDDLTEAAAEAELASRLNPLAVEPLFAAATIAERRGRLDEAREYLLQAVRRQPHSIDGWARLVRFEFTRLDRAAIRRAALKALELDPINPATIALARRALANSALPQESPAATGTPLETQVPVTASPAAGVPAPDTAPVPDGAAALPPGAPAAGTGGAAGPDAGALPASPAP